jgi:predicted nucleic acid-binding protein
VAHLSDTNIVGRWALPQDPLYPQVRAAILALRQRGETLYITAQNLLEFRAFATRPLEANGLGMTTEQASVEIARIETAFPLLPETPAIYPLWRTLADTYGVMGRQVYDARLVAVMMANGVSHLLTLNPTHFRRFEGITVVIPNEVRP